MRPPRSTRPVPLFAGLVLLALPLPGCPDAPSAAVQEVEQVEQAEDPPPRGPGRRRAVNGVGGVTCTSTLTLEAFPDAPQRMEMTYVFPDRVRWRMAPAQSRDPRQRRLWYRWGSELWRVEAGSERSIPTPPEERALELLRMELRRVALIWPADLDWKGSKTLQRAELKGLGEIRAELDAETGRPTALEFRIATEDEGPPVERAPDERLEEIRWKEQERRHWPGSWAIVVGGEKVAGEEFDQILPKARYVDSYFKPLDRRDTLVTSPPSEPREMPLAARIVHRSPLDAGTDWKTAFATADERLEGWRKKLEGTGRELSTRATFQLDRQGRPVAVELRLLGLPEGPLPEGWRRLEGGKGLSILMRGLRGLNAAQLDELLDRIPEGHRAGTPYARIQREAEGRIGLVQLVLPLVPRE